MPGARPHIPVGQHAALAEFEAIAPLFPVFGVIPDDPRRSLRRPVRVREHGHDDSGRADSSRDGAR